MSPYNYFPMTYPQFPYQQPQQPQTQQQAYTPPTIHAEIIQVENEAEARNYPVAAGCTQMMIARDDSAIFIKSAYANAPSQVLVYEKKQIEAQAVTDVYVTKDELDKRLNDFMSKLKNPNQNKKQEGKNGTV